VTAFSLREVAGGGFSRNLPAGAPIPPTPNLATGKPLIYWRTLRHAGFTPFGCADHRMSRR